MDFIVDAMLLVLQKLTKPLFVWAASMGMMGGLGMMGGNPLSAMQSFMAMRSPGLDMSNPVIAQIMMQQVSSEGLLCSLG